MHQLTRFGLVNTYLVEEEDGLTLIDTGISGSDKQALAAAAQLGRPIVRLLITHAHADHVGTLDKLHAALPDAEVLISARDARLLEGDMTLDPGEPQTKLRVGKLGVSTRPTRLLQPGDRVGSLEAVGAPGHSPGQLAFLDVRDRSLYCADAFHTIGGVATTTKPRLPFPLPGFATWDGALDLQSAKALRALDPARLAPGHGKVVEAPGAAMDAAIAKG
jgi:glyoxylase-like metal-dependent hydrolase (beta-lactamase superfamily II)